MSKNRFIEYETKDGRKAIKCTMETALGNKFTGVAVCSPNDEYSFDVGLRLAMDRALLKQQKFISKNLQKKINQQQEKVFTLARQRARVENRIIDAEDRIWELE